MLAIGPFAAISLADARTERAEARKRLTEGVDPSVRMRLNRIAAETAGRDTFGLVAAEFLSNLEANGAAPATLTKNKWLLEDLAAPLANRPTAEITAAEILDLLKRIVSIGEIVTYAPPQCGQFSVRRSPIAYSLHGAPRVLALQSADAFSRASSIVRPAPPPQPP